MPLHEYLCESCGRAFETIQNFGEARLTTCDRCGGPLKRLISAPAVQFKGSGWYVSDYGKAGSGPRKSEDSSATAASPSGSSGSSSESAAASGSSESKPETMKTETKNTEGTKKSEGKSKAEGTKPEGKKKAD